MTATPIGPFLEPVRKTVEVGLAPPQAFAFFTERFGEWWPLHDPYSVFGDRAQSCGMELSEGGEIFETSVSGERALWGRVVAWEPPARLEFSWFPGRDESVRQTVEITFVASPAGTLVHLEHRDWQRLGAAADATRLAYEGGWAVVLPAFATSANGRRPV